jgi:uncharacterized protein
MRSATPSRRLVATVLTCVVILSTLAIALPTQAANAAPPDWRANVLHFAEQHLKHPAWGLSHSMRDYDLARALAKQDHVTLDDDVLYAAAYLHDIAALPPL